MDYISEIFERLDIQQFCSLLQSGTETKFISGESYEQRIKAASTRINNILEETIHKRKKHRKLEIEICRYASDCEKIHMEIGMKCGAILMMNLLKP